MTTFISKETINRLLKDVRHIIINPLTDQGIYYIHDDSDMLKGYAMIVGPSETPYFGGFYFFEISYPYDYPHSPPKVKYCTNSNGIRFNPNLYTCGKVCVSLLNTWRGDQWTSCQSISTVLLTLCTLLCSNPLLNEPGVDKNHSDMKNYNEIIEYSNLSIAVCDIVRKKSGVYLPFFENFYPYVKENFNKNYDKLLEIAQKKSQNTDIENKFFKTGFYNMNVNVRYNDVILKLNESKEMSEVL
jgi:ubiquitin-conjugating enzyme E2 Z